MTQNGLGGATLTVDTGPLAGIRFLLDRPLITIGRTGENDVSLDDSMVSKNHCRIITQGDNYLVEDLGSSNGTVVNGQQVNTYMLQDGDKLFLGETTLTFSRHAAAAQAPGAAPAAGEAGSRKWLWATLGIVSGLVVVATAVVLILVFVVLPERDSIAPSVSFNRPAPGDAFSISMPVPNGTDVPVEVTASDDKGLDRVDVLAGEGTKPIKTFKATSSRRESGAKGQKTEKFTMVWHSTDVGEHTLKVKAYDWRGNVSSTESVQVKVDLNADVNNAHAYCQQVDQKIAEYNVFKGKFSSAYSGASRNTTTAEWVQTDAVFTEILRERRSLLERLNGMNPPPQFAESHNAFKATVESAISADEAAIQWAGAMYYASDPYYSRYYPESVSAANGYKKQVESYSAAAQGNAAAFNRVNTAARQGQLGITGPIARLQ